MTVLKANTDAHAFTLQPKETVPVLIKSQTKRQKCSKDSVDGCNIEFFKSETKRKLSVSEKTYAIETVSTKTPVRTVLFMRVPEPYAVLIIKR